MHRPIVILQGLAVLALVIAPASAAVHDVQQQGLTFDPAQITINQGDVVRWHWNDGIHTVTNGVNPNSVDAGALFDAPIDAGHATFEYTFDTAGSYPYFCTYHFGLGMTGAVTVNSNTPVRATTWSRIKALYTESGE
jgi:plastocyanin